MKSLVGSTYVRFVATALLVAAWQAGCSAPATPEEVGTVRVTITTVPADVSCIRLSAVGATRTVEQNFDVTAGASSVLAMPGIPTGSVVFTGRAFPSACASVPTGANPNWISDPVTVQVTGGITAEVALVMRRNGNANVSVDFVDDAAPVATTTMLTSSANPAVTGQRVVLTARVTAASGSLIPTGSVRFSVPAGELLTEPVQANGTAGILINAITFGTRQFTAEYLPTGAFQPSSATLTQVVNAATTRVALGVPSPSVEINGVTFVPIGTQLTFTAGVNVLAPGTGRPNGIMTFSDQSGVLGTSQVTNGQTSFVTPFPNVGPASLTATWNEQSGFLASSSTVQFQVVNELPDQNLCIPPSGVVSWWHADDDFSDAFSNNHGTPIGQVTFAAGRRNNGFALNGNPGSFVQVPDAPNLQVTTGLTIDAWVNATVLSGRIVDKVTPFQEDGYLLDFVNDRLRMQVGGSAVVTDPLTIAGTLTHVAGVYDGTRIALFINGAPVAGTTTTMTSAPVNNLPVRIGADGGGGSLFTGIIDEPRIFSRGLSNAEVQTLFDQYAICP